MPLEVISNSFPNRLTKLTYDVNQEGVPYEFDIYKKNNGEEDEFVESVFFYEGSTEHHLNGVFEEDLILMVLTRLNYLQQTKDACTENAESILYLEKVLQAMSKRKEDNEKRNNGVYTL